MDATQVLKKIGDEDATIPDIRDLLAKINGHWGGTDAYAETIVKDVKAAPTGSSQRIGFHNSYLAAIAKFGGNGDIDSADEAALRAEAAEIMANQKTAEE